jgi:hypothetical protein
MYLVAGQQNKKVTIKDERYRRRRNGIPGSKGHRERTSSSWLIRGEWLRRSTKPFQCLEKAAKMSKDGDTYVSARKSLSIRRQDERLYSERSRQD